MKQLYFGGTILTMEEPPTAEALLVEDGRILAAGSRAELETMAPDAEQRNLGGHTLMPAFIDGHSHITALAQTMGLVQLTGADSLAEIERRVHAFKKEHHVADGAWIIGFGYDQNYLKEGRHPTAADLDGIAPHNPLMVGHASGHMGAANTAALRKLGVSADTPDPEGGRIGRLEGSREPDGYLEETAFTTLGYQVPQDASAALDNLLRAEQVYLSHGIATIHDGLTKAPEWKLLKAAAEQRRFSADIIAYIDLRDNAAILPENPDYKNYVNRLKIGGYKLFLDGSPQGRTAWVTAPYEGNALPGEGPDYCGYPIYEDAQVLEFLRKALRERVQIAVHCNGDAAAAQLLSCYETAYRETGNDVRPLMIHAQLLRPNQLPALRRLHMVASFFVAHTYYWGDVHLKNFGAARAERISPAKSALDAGVVFDFHQDTPVIPPDMLETVWCAVNRTTREGVTLGEQERLTPLEALKAVTINAAYACFEEGEKGSLLPGKRADLVILDGNPLACPPDCIRDIRVLETLKDGATVYKA